MRSAVEVAEAALGSLVILFAIYDLFQSVVLPRPAVGRARLSPVAVRRLWSCWRWLGTRIARPERREAFLAAFGPLAVLVLLAAWMGALVAGFGLVLHGLRDQVRPRPDDLGSALYLSALSLLTVGFGDIVPVGALARVVVVVEAATGLGAVALVISLLFSLYGSFQRREVAVVALDASAGAPPSGLQLLETCARHRMRRHLEEVFGDWRLWAAEVLESHLAYPILTYFRSSHDNEAWLNSFGAVMDAAALVVTTVEGGPEGPARLMLKVGGHLVEDLSWYFRFDRREVAAVDRSEFDRALGRLAAAGYRLREVGPAWEAFTRLRAGYAPALHQLAHHLAILPAEWVSDRSYLPHRDSRRPANVSSS